MRDDADQTPNRQDDEEADDAVHDVFASFSSLGAIARLDEVFDDIEDEHNHGNSHEHVYGYIHVRHDGIHDHVLQSLAGGGIGKKRNSQHNN